MKDKELRKLIGSRAKQRRLELGVNQPYIAEKMGVTASTIQRYEAGTIDNTKKLVLDGLSEALHVSVEWLKGETEEMTSDVTDKRELQIRDTMTSILSKLPYDMKADEADFSKDLLLLMLKEYELFVDSFQYACKNFKGNTEDATIAKVMGKENKLADVTTQKGRWDAAKELIDAALNTKVKSVDLGIKLVTGQMPSLDAVDNVVYSSYMRTDAIYALKKAEADLAGNSKDKQKIAEYQAAFDMAKEITKKQYESMLTYYQSQAYGAKDKNDKIQFVQDEMKKLNDITYGNYYCNGR